MLSKPDSSVNRDDTPQLIAKNGVEGVVTDASPAFPTLLPSRAPVIAPLRETDQQPLGKVPRLDLFPAPPVQDGSRESENVPSEPPRMTVAFKDTPAPPMGEVVDAPPTRLVTAPNDNGEFKVKVKSALVTAPDPVVDDTADPNAPVREPAPVLDAVSTERPVRKYETRLEAIASGRKGFNPENIEVLSLDRPRAFLFHEFLTDEECDHFVKVASSQLTHSGVVDTETGGSSISNIRTSMGAFLAKGMDAMTRDVERRIAEWSQIPEEHGESMQVLRYEKSQEYRAHYDYFFHKAGEANNRIATGLLYLSDVEEGGETVFPNTQVPKGRTGTWSECGMSGLAVKPQKRAVLLFWGMKTGGELDGGSSHAGCPVIRGVKWTATKWMHVGPGNVYDANHQVYKEPRPAPRPGCEDKEERCYTWGEQGECQRNKPFMESSCGLTCNFC